MPAAPGRMLAALRQTLEADAPQQAQRERQRLQAQRLASPTERERAVLALAVCRAR